MIQHLLFVYEMNLKRAGQLVADLSDEQMAAQPAGVINHPAWTLGHLGATSDALAGSSGYVHISGRVAGSMQDGWYPERESRRLSRPRSSSWSSSARSMSGAGAMAEADAERLQQPTAERMRARFPTVGDFAAALMTVHEGNHLGQVTAWRRAMGLGPA